MTFKYATIKDLKEFLSQFPEDTEVELVHYTDYAYGGIGREFGVTVEQLELIDHQRIIEKEGYYKGGAFEYYPHSKSLTLGIMD